MPKGPQGRKRPADVIGAAVMVPKIATGEILEDAGETCIALHDERVRNVKSRRLQCDEIWSAGFWRIVKLEGLRREGQR